MKRVMAILIALFIAFPIVLADEGETFSKDKYVPWDKLGEHVAEQASASHNAILKRTTSLMRKRSRFATDSGREASIMAARQRKSSASLGRESYISSTKLSDENRENTPINTYGKFRRNLKDGSVQARGLLTRTYTKKLTDDKSKSISFDDLSSKLGKIGATKRYDRREYVLKARRQALNSRTGPVGPSTK
jgi:hypothetical protein